MKVQSCYQTMHVSIHVQISAFSCALHVLVTFLCLVLHFLLREANGREPGLIMY